MSDLTSFQEIGAMYLDVSDEEAIYLSEECPTSFEEMVKMLRVWKSQTSSELSGPKLMESAKTLLKYCSESSEKEKDVEVVTPNNNIPTRISIVEHKESAVELLTGLSVSGNTEPDIVERAKDRFDELLSSMRLHQYTFDTMPIFYPSSDGAFDLGMTLEAWQEAVEFKEMVGTWKQRKLLTWTQLFDTYITCHPYTLKRLRSDDFLSQVSKNVLIFVRWAIREGYVSWNDESIMTKELLSSKDLGLEGLLNENPVRWSSAINNLPYTSFDENVDREDRIDTTYPTWVNAQQDVVQLKGLQQEIARNPY